MPPRPLSVYVCVHTGQIIEREARSGRAGLVALTGGLLYVGSPGAAWPAGAPRRSLDTGSRVDVAAPSTLLLFKENHLGSPN